MVKVTTPPSCDAVIVLIPTPSTPFLPLTPSLPESPLSPLSPLAPLPPATGLNLAKNSLSGIAKS